MVCSGSLEVHVQGEVVSDEMAGSPEEMPKVVGVITSRTRARRGAGEWIEIGRKRRAFVPDGLPAPSVGEVGEFGGGLDRGHCASQWASPRMRQATPGTRP